MMTRTATFLLLLISALLGSCASVEAVRQEPMTLTIIGLNDVHGELLSRPGHGGLEGISGFIDATRAARALSAAARAVGQACGRNPLPLIYPCHRVVAADRSLGGFSAGLDKKRKLLDLEGVSVRE